MIEPLHAQGWSPDITFKVIASSGFLDPPTSADITVNDVRDIMRRLRQNDYIREREMPVVYQFPDFEPTFYDGGRQWEGEGLTGMLLDDTTPKDGMVELRMDLRHAREYICIRMSRKELEIIEQEHKNEDYKE